MNNHGATRIRSRSIDSHGTSPPQENPSQSSTNPRQLRNLVSAVGETFERTTNYVTTDDKVISPRCEHNL